MHGRAATRGGIRALSGLIERLRQSLRGQEPGEDDDPAYLPPLSRSETRALVDERARRDLNMSGDEFRRRLAAGELPDTSSVRSLAILVGEDPR
jgi:hypothetical protein